MLDLLIPTSCQTMSHVLAVSFLLDAITDQTPPQQFLCPVLVLDPYYGLNVYPRFVEILMPNVMVTGSGAFGRWFKHEARALMNGICVLIKEAQESPLIPFTIQGHNEKSANRRSYLDLRISSLQNWDITFFWLWATSSVVFCYRNPNRIRHWLPTNSW